MMSKAMDKVIAPIAQALRDELATFESTGKFKMPFKIQFPYNAATQNEYGGINIFRLSLEDRATPVWGTFNQWNSLGYRVKKGAKGCAIYTPGLFKKIVDEEKQTYTKMELPPKAVYVFNGEDVENTDGNQIDVSKINKDEKNISHEEYFNQFSINMNTGLEAFYRPSEDSITMPQFDKFISNDRYFAVLAHEVIHWTGHHDRCDRTELYERSDYNVAVEELTAEFGAALICAHLKIDNTEMRTDHLEYLHSWAKLIKNNDDAIEQALIAASGAYRYLNTLIKK